MFKTLEQAIPNKRTTPLKMGEATCVCGNRYNLAQRIEQVKNKPKPNTAGTYHADACWVRESHNEDFS